MRKNPLILDLEFSADDSSDGTLPEIVLTAPTPEALSRKVNTMEVLESSANPDQRLDEESVNESIENRSQDGCCQRMVNFFRGCCGY